MVQTHTRGPVEDGSVVVVSRSSLSSNLGMAMINLAVIAAVAALHNVLGIELNENSRSVGAFIGYLIPLMDHSIGDLHRPTLMPSAWSRSLHSVQKP